MSGPTEKSEDARDRDVVDADREWVLGLKGRRTRGARCSWGERERERVRRTRRDQCRSEGRKERIAIVGKVGCNDFIEKRATE